MATAPDSTPATLTATVAAVTSSSDTTGTGARVVPCPPRGSARGTSTPHTAAITAIATNASRQPPNCANSPPSAGPTKLPTPYIADISALPRVHNRCGSADRTAAKPSPDSNPAPSPWTPRPASSTAITGLTAQTSEPARNTPKPSR